MGVGLLAGALLLGVPLSFVVLGSVFVWLGLRMRRQAAAFRARARRTQALVTDLRMRSRRGADRDVSWTYHPVLRFTTSDGRQVETESPWGSTPAPARPGQTVDVLYDPADPTQAQVADRRLGGCLTLAFVLVGGTLALTGLGVVVFLALVAVQR